jgi:cell division protease FtsH
MVMRLPERDSYSYHRDQMLANLSVSMGGRVAEELIFGYDKVSSGASSDIQHATGLARNMVTRWGMSDKLGPLQYEDTQEGYLGYSGSQRTMASDETNKQIDAEIRKLVETAHKRATDILTKNRDKLELLAKAMLEYETLSGEEITELMQNGKIDRPEIPATGSGLKPVRGSSIPKAGKRFAGAAARDQA